MLNWENLLNQNRPRDLAAEQLGVGTGAGRTEMERDYDRILFSTPVRRLADKTQVFPMEDHDSVRTRLTHSHEVANLARGIGVRLSFEHSEAIFGSSARNLNLQRNVPACLAAVGLAHDLGNPPFGHQGEVAIQYWFQANIGDDGLDFTSFDGNAQTFRLLTRLQLLNDDYGLNLTVGTLAALLKYPSIYGSNAKGGYKKSGVFKSEEDVASLVWEHTGLVQSQRHPLAYILEACDDIAYSIIDAEDTVKKGYASFFDLAEVLSSIASDDRLAKDVLDKAWEKHKEFAQASLSPRELNDLSMQMFRINAMSGMVDSLISAFKSNIASIMEGGIDPGFELIENSAAKKLCETLQNKFSFPMGFRHREVLKLELEGHNYITKMMNYLWEAINKPDDKGAPFERYIYGEISENYRRIFESSDRGRYEKCQLLADSISGMTESYLVRKCNEYSKL